MKKVRVITINTDASFNPQHKLGGYAFYIVCDLFKIQKAGMFKKPVDNSKDAEIMCIGNAISTLLAQPELPETTWLIINSDCLYGMSDIRKSTSELAKKVNRMWAALINRTKSRHNKMRHVKAHNGTPDARSWVNDWCDKEAKKWMRIAVERSQKQVKE
jgi:ribonuclease HI